MLKVISDAEGGMVRRRVSSALSSNAEGNNV